MQDHEKILITGSGGLIGHALSESLARQHSVLGMDRLGSSESLPWVTGCIECPEDLTRLDEYEITAAVHLAGVTGGCTERDGMIVNVEGTRCLMRYLLDRGCRKFILASSSAVVGFQSILFRPQQLPFPDEAPCLDRDGYGFSKYLMEEVARYYYRQNPDIDVIALRLAAICPDDSLPPPVKVKPLCEWAIGNITVMALSDAVKAFQMAVTSSHKPGVRVMNAAPVRAWAADPVAMILRNWYGDNVDVSYFEQPTHEYDSLYDVSRIREELGFVASSLPET